MLKLKKVKGLSGTDSPFLVIKYADRADIHDNVGRDERSIKTDDSIQNINTGRTEQSVICAFYKASDGYEMPEKRRWKPDGKGCSFCR